MTTLVPVSTNGVPAGPPFGRPRVGSCPGCGYPRRQHDACPWCRTRPHQGYAPGPPADPTALAGSAWNSRGPEGWEGARVGRLERDRQGRPVSRSAGELATSSSC